MVEHSLVAATGVSSNPSRRLPVRVDQFESQPAIAGAGRPIHSSFSSEDGSNPSKHKLLTPPPNPPPPPLRKCDIQFQGDRGLKIKKSIGGSFCQAK